MHSFTSEFADPADSDSSSFRAWVQGGRRGPVDEIEPANELEIDPALLDAIRPAIYRQAYREAAKIQLRIMDEALLHILKNNHSAVAFWQVCFALGSARCLGRTESELAKSLCVERATISKGAIAVRRNCGLLPNQNSKGIEAIQQFSESRLKQIPA